MLLDQSEHGISVNVNNAAQPISTQRLTCTTLHQQKKGSIGPYNYYWCSYIIHVCLTISFEKFIVYGSIIGVPVVS